jgi:hypothetical protein
VAARQTFIEPTTGVAENDTQRSAPFHAGTLGRPQVKLAADWVRAVVDTPNTFFGQSVRENRIENEPIP